MSDRPGQDSQSDPTVALTLLDGAPALVSAHRGADHRYVFVNRAFKIATAGRSCIGLPLASAGIDALDDGLTAAFDGVHRTGARRNGGTVRLDAAATGGNEGERWYRQVLEPWRDPAGELIGVLRFALDVTAEVRARRLADQRQAERDFSLQAGGGVGTWDWDVATDRVAVNARFAQLFGHAPALAADGLGVGRFVERIAKADRARVRSAIEEAVRTGEDYYQEYRVVDCDGKERWVAARGRCCYDAHGRPTNFPGAVFDITYQMRMRADLDASRAALGESEDRRRRAMAAGKVGTFEYFVDDARAIWDPMSIAIFGFDQETSVPLEAIAETVHPDDFPGWQADLAKALDPAGDGIHAVEMRITRRDTGELRWIEARGETTFRDGKPTLMLGTIRDITERREFEQRLKLLNRELNHRVKNLFAVVQSLIGTTAKGAKDAPEFAARLRERIAALAAGHLVGLDERTLEPIALPDLVAAVLRPYVGARLTVDGTAVVIARSAVTPLSLILHELATNALKYGAWADADGAVHIGWEAMAPPEPSSEPSICLTWRETVGAGRIATAPTGHGFGSRLIEASTTQLGGALNRVWGDKGLTLTLTFPT